MASFFIFCYILCLFFSSRNNYVNVNEVKVMTKVVIRVDKNFVFLIKLFMI